MNTPQLMPAYARGETTFVRGEGARLWDAQGNEYLDGLAGIAVCGLGHAHPDVTQAICEQAKTLTHSSNLFHSLPQQALAKTLCELAQMDNVFFGNSGAEANELAIKIARKYGHQKNIAVPNIIVMENSFHGRTLATLSASGSKKVREWFEPFVEGFVRVPYNDIAAIEAAAANNPNIVAIFVEPIQGEGGIQIPAPDYLNQLRKICDAKQWLLMLDEIQSGMGRTGKFLASHHNNIHADVVTLAKALGNGLPIGACMARGIAAQVIQPGNHGSTYGGNPLACHTASAVLAVIARDNLMARAASLGDKILHQLRNAASDFSKVKQVRGMGLMLAVEMQQACGNLVELALAERLVINVTAGNVVRILPPLIYSDEQAEQLVQRLTAALARFEAQNF